MSTRGKDFVIGASLVLATIVWGANNTTIRYLVDPTHGAWPAFWTTGSRMFIAGLILLSLLRWTTWFGPHRKTPPEVSRALWLRGAPLFIGWAAGFAWACKYTPVSHASLYLAASPIWGLLLEERPRLTRESLRKYFAAILALGGIITLFWPKLSAVEAGDNKWIGDIIAFAASWSWTIYSRESRRLSESISGMTYTAHTAWRSSLLMVPLVAWEFTRELPRMESHLIGWQVFSIFAGTIVGLGIWNNALRYWPTSRALLFNNLIPIFTMLWAWFCLREPMTATFWLAMALVITGVFIGLAPWRKTQSE